MPHQLFIAPSWASAEAWLLDRVAAHVRQRALPTARIAVPSYTLARHLEDRLLAGGIEGFFRARLYSPVRPDPGGP